MAGKPGVWDPLIGVSWNRASETFEGHASVEGGGFGVGADVDLGAAARVDWKFSRHVGVTGGYNFIYLKLTHAVTDGNAVVRLTAHGPAVGLALYF